MIPDVEDTYTNTHPLLESIMAHTLTVDKSAYLGNNPVMTTRKTTSADNHIGPSVEIAAAKPGALTTRTSDSVGTLTMDSGHGFTTADLIDIYWEADTTTGQTAGKRVGVIVGTVATDDVPITGGSGDALPLDEHPITAMERHSEDMAFTGDDAVYIYISSPVPAYVSFAEADGTTIVGTPIPLTVDDAGTTYGYTWQEDTGVTNPLAGGAVGVVLLSHGSEEAQTIQVDVGYN